MAASTGKVQISDTELRTQFPQARTPQDFADIRAALDRGVTIAQIRASL